MLTPATAEIFSYLIASFKAFPAENFGTLLALMVIAAPVLGFLPFLCFLLLVENVPNPTNVTFWFFFKAFVISPKSSVIASFASLFEIPAFAEILSTKSCLFICFTSFLSKLLTVLILAGL